MFGLKGDYGVEGVQFRGDYVDGMLLSEPRVSFVMFSEQDSIKFVYILETTD